MKSIAQPMFMCALLFAIVLTPQLAFAQSPFPEDVKLTPTEKFLLEKLNAAEKRLAELENQKAKPAKTNIPPAVGSKMQFDLQNVSNSHWLEDKEEKTTYEDRIKSLEKNWDSYAKAKKKADDKAKSKPTFKIGGRIHFDYWGFPDESTGIGFFENAATGLDPENRFQFRRIRLEMKGDILDTMFWRTQIDFNNPAVAEYKDVYIGFKELPFNQSLIIGNQKRPIGLDHLNSSRFNVFTERPMVVETFNSDARRIGATMNGYTDDESMLWSYGAFLLENTRSDGRAIGDSFQGSLNMRLAGSPWYDETSGGRGYFHWGLAAMVAKPDGDVKPGDTNRNEGRFSTRPEARSTSSWLDTGRIAGANWFETVAVEGILNIGSLQIAGEWMSTFMQRDNTTAGTGDDLQFHGGYIYAAYMLTGEHITYTRRTGTINRVTPYENFFLVDRCCGGTGRGWGAWQIAARYSYLDLTDADITGGIGNSTTMALNWWWTPYSKLQFNAIYFDEHNRGPVGGYDAGNAWITGVRFAVDF